MRLIYLLAVWIHILAATVWIGGMLFLVLVVVPAIRRPEYKAVAASLVSWTGARFRTVAWICLFLLLLTGILILAIRGIGLTDLGSLSFWGSTFGMTLGFKLIIVVTILLLSAIHDFRVGPRAIEAWQHEPSGAEAARFRHQASWFGRLNLLLGLLVVALAVILVRGAPW